MLVYRHKNARPTRNIITSSYRIIWTRGEFNTYIWKPLLQIIIAFTWLRADLILKMLTNMQFKIFYPSLPHAKLWWLKYYNLSCWSCRWGENTSLNCGHQQAYCSSRRRYMSIENHGKMMSTDKATDLSTRATWQFYSSHLAASRRNGRWEWWIWPD
jgi:hypothetical protein